MAAEHLTPHHPEPDALQSVLEIDACLTQARAIVRLMGIRANAVVAKKGSLAYDTSKAAANHLVRELAIEYSPMLRVNAVAPATVVKGSTMFPRDRVIASLAKYSIPFEDAEDTDALTEKLSVGRITVSNSKP